MMDEAEQRQFDALKSRNKELLDENDKLSYENRVLKDMLEQWQRLNFNYQKMLWGKNND